MVCFYVNSRDKYIFNFSTLIYIYISSFSQQPVTDIHTGDALEETTPLIHVIMLVIEMSPFGVLSG